MFLLLFFTNIFQVMAESTNSSLVVPKEHPNLCYLLSSCSRCGNNCVDIKIYKRYIMTKWNIAGVWLRRLSARWAATTSLTSSSSPPPWTSVGSTARKLSFAGFWGKRFEISQSDPFLWRLIVLNVDRVLKNQALCFEKIFIKAKPPIILPSEKASDWILSSFILAPQSIPPDTIIR